MTGMTKAEAMRCAAEFLCSDKATPENPDLYEATRKRNEHNLHFPYEVGYLDGIEMAAESLRTLANILEKRGA